VYVLLQTITVFPVASQSQDDFFVSFNKDTEKEKIKNA